MGQDFIVIPILDIGAIDRIVAVADEDTGGNGIRGLFDDSPRIADKRGQNLKFFIAKVRRFVHVMRDEYAVQVSEVCDGICNGNGKSVHILSLHDFLATIVECFGMFGVCNDQQMGTLGIFQDVQFDAWPDLADISYRFADLGILFKIKMVMVGDRQYPDLGGPDDLVKAFGSYVPAFCIAGFHLFGMDVNIYFHLDYFYT